MQDDYDVVIVGAGMVGASLACAIAPTNLSIALIEAVSPSEDWQPSYDDRGISLSPSSKRVLEHIGVWRDICLHATPIKKIHVSNQKKFGFTHLAASEENVSELGHVVIARSLGSALHKKIRQYKNITLICPAELKDFLRQDSKLSLKVARSGNTKTINTRLLVGADGSRSIVRKLAGIEIKERDFKQTAIVSNLTTQKRNQSIAYERFTSHGPIALLPINKNRSVLIFTVHSDQENYYLNMSDNQYLKTIETEFGRRLGKIQKLGERRPYPILFIEAMQQFQDNLILLGNAAHTLHPNAAQGFNLGLRDIAGLSECIFSGLEKKLSIDDINILKNYLELRHSDQQRVIEFSNGLATCFDHDSSLFTSITNITMLLFDCIPPFKSSFLKKTMGIAGHQPKLVRGLYL
jgi:2-octaprenyl-6-methoxyphenol hydroxylase